MGILTMIYYALTLAVFVLFILTIYFFAVGFIEKKFKLAKKYALSYVCVNLIRLIFEIVFKL